MFPFLAGSYVKHLYAVDGLLITCGSIDMFKIGGRIDIMVVVIFVVIVFDGRSCAFCEERPDISQTKNQ